MSLSHLPSASPSLPQPSLHNLGPHVQDDFQKTLADTVTNLEETRAGIEYVAVALATIETDTRSRAEEVVRAI